MVDKAWFIGGIVRFNVNVKVAVLSSKTFDRFYRAKVSNSARPPFWKFTDQFQWLCFWGKIAKLQIRYKIRIGTSLPKNSSQLFYHAWYFAAQLNWYFVLSILYRQLLSNNNCQFRRNGQLNAIGSMQCFTICHCNENVTLSELIYKSNSPGTQEFVWDLNSNDFPRLGRSFCFTLIIQIHLLL